MLELEPQTLWLADDPISGPFREYRPGLEAFARLPGHKLVHSVGIPLGGARQPDPGQMALIRDTATRLDSPWVSEHLSVAGTPHRAAGFLLPPLQTDAGVETAVTNIRAFSAGVGRPVAVETGVAYFRRKSFEMPDGRFVACVAAEAGCGLLLDLHNLYCNHRNGRIDLDETLTQLPLDRVWEVHLAGGDEMGGVWLDSHSGPMPDELADRARDLISTLPNLGAITFEIYDTFLRQLDNATFDRIVDQLRDIWEGAGQARSDAPPAALRRTVATAPLDPAAWEESLTAAVWRAEPDAHPWPEDHEALGLYALLARSFRGSMLTRAMPRTVRYGLLRDGADFEQSIKSFFDDVPPQLYAPLEAEAFQGWWRAQRDEDPLMAALMDYDLAFIRLLRDPSPQVVRFPGDPRPVFEALAEARMPSCPNPPEWELEILPDDVSPDDFAGAIVGS